MSDYPAGLFGEVINYMSPKVTATDCIESSQLQTGRLFHPWCHAVLYNKAYYRYEADLLFNSRSLGTFFLSSLLLVKILQQKVLSASLQAVRAEQDVLVKIREFASVEKAVDAMSVAMEDPAVDFVHCHLLYYLHFFVHYMFIHFYLLNLCTFLNMWRHCLTRAGAHIMKHQLYSHQIYGFDKAVKHYRRLMRPKFLLVVALMGIGWVSMKWYLDQTCMRYIGVQKCIMNIKINVQHVTTPHRFTHYLRMYGVKWLSGMHPNAAS